MEFEDMKPGSPDDQIEAWLRAHRVADPLPDDGFSTGVMAALPARRPVTRETGFPLRTLAISAGFAVAAGALLMGVGGSDLPKDIAGYGQQAREAAAAFATASTAQAFGVAAAALAVAYWQELRAALTRLAGFD